MGIRHNSVFNKVLASAAVLVLTIGCSKSSENKNIENMVSPTQTQNGLSGTEITLKRDSMGQKFLFQTSIITQEQIPMFEGGRSRIVTFNVKGNIVVMNETADGNQVTPELDQSLILATFPITKETSDTITIDFNKGMTNLFIVKDWSAQDSDGVEHDPGYQVVDVSSSYLENLVYKNNHFVITQKASVKSPGFMGPGSLKQIVAKYYLTPYAPSADFTTTISKGMKTFGFFEVAPKIQTDGTTKIFASKFNVNKPIVYAISANTPAEYHDVIRDAVLYWNKAFGYEAVKVVDAPAGVTAPDLDYNVIQWVNWESAGFAYADAQMDPANGEILHAQIFMTSVFALSSRARAARTLSRIKEFNPAGLASVKLAGLTDGALCGLSHNQRLVGMIENLLVQNATDAMILRVSQDYVREVVAHEVGHTLGLRHNFAGNHAQSYSMNDRATLFKDYLDNSNVPADLIPTSSVMEYQNFEEASFSGHQMNALPKAFEYDRKAIETLYLGKTYKRADVPAFCTDSAIGVYTDCMKFDSGRNTAEWASWVLSSTFANLKYTIAEALIRAKSPAPGEVEKGIDEIKLMPSGEFIKLLDDGRNPFLGSLQDGSLWSIFRGFSVLDESNKSEVEEAQRAKVKKDIEDLGGLAVVLPAVKSDFVETQTKAYLDLINSGKYDSGTGLYGVAYTLTPEEIEIMKERGVAYIEMLYEKLLMADVSALDSLSDLADDDLTNKMLLPYLNSRLQEYVFTLDSTVTPTVKKVTTKDNAVVEVVLPVFKYPQKVRAKAGGLLSASRFKGFDVGRAERKANSERYGKLLKDTNLDSDKMPYGTLPTEVRQWITDNQSIL